MRTYSFYNGLLKTAMVVMLCAFVFSTCLYADYIDNSIKIMLGTKFFYVMSPETHIEVGVYESQQLGGAGYYLEDDKTAGIVYGVYFDRQHGEDIIKSVCSFGKTTTLIERNAPILYMKSPLEKKNAKMIVGALDTYYGYMQVLFQEIERLDKGCTQESCKRILDTLGKQLLYLSTEYSETYPQFSTACASVGGEILETKNEIVYASKLRWILCKMSEEYLTLVAQFSL